MPVRPDLLAAYHPDGYDEAVAADGEVRPEYGWMFRALSRMGNRGLAAAESALRTEQRARRVTFRVGDGAPDRLFPLDLVPRIVTAEDWAGLSAGLTQRVRALEAFLRDVYGPRQIIADGVIPASVIDDAPGWNRQGKPPPADAVRIAVAGIDLVRDRADHWLVLEDNLRVPSGIGYAITSRRLIRSVMPDLEAPGSRRPRGGGGPAAQRLARGDRAGRSAATTRSRCCRRARSTPPSTSTSCSPRAWACRW